MADAVNARVTALQCDVTDADEKLKQLYRLIADGIGIAPKPRSKSHSAQAIQIDPALLERSGRSMRENFTSGSIPLRKTYLQSLIDVIEIDDPDQRQQRRTRKSGPGPPKRGHSGFVDEC